MNSFFPIIQEDELLFSLFARYHERSLNKNEKITLTELGSPRINPLLPNNIQNFIETLGPFSQDKEYYLIHHTLFNYYCNFLPPIQSNDLLHYMIYGLKERKSNVKPQLLSNSFTLKFCPNCVRDDIKNLGESYWRLPHQLPTSLICLKHDVILENWNYSESKTSLKTLKIRDLSTGVFVEFSNKTRFYARKFAKQSLKLNKEKSNLYFKFRYGKFYLVLIANGYVNSTGQVDVLKLRSDIEKYYGNELMKLARFNERIYEQIVEYPLICNIHFTYIETLFFINFFFNSLSDFMKCNLTLPTGEIGPFPCLNYFCENFNQCNIQDAKIYFDKQKRRLIINFKCVQCNCEYDKIFRIKDWHLIETWFYKTEEWKINVLSLIYNKGLSIETVSNKLHISSIEIEELLKENKREKWFEPEDLSICSETSINWIKRDKQVLLYLKSIVSKGIMFEKSKVYSWIYLTLDRTSIKAELQYLLKTNEYIEKHKLFDEYLYNKSK
ncbi:TnsD family Tn7-like transposition protein [Lysinibacillus sp. NPDC093688]|uniref:TnsD family Tn7-like transposition protein n=1 Tax=Lysinibacillus sp. NPDC093688 TaxID=3390577 RepID=UPI003D02A3DE